jgi:tRNA modification GTPase
LHVIDTAGLRDSDNAVEQIGIEKAWTEINSADILLLLIDGNTNKSRDIQKIWSQLSRHAMPEIPVVLVVNKSDLSASEQLATDSESHSEKHAETLEKDRFKIHLSAKTGEGLQALKQTIKTLIGFNETGETGYMARRRHLVALDKTQLHMQQGKQQLLKYQAAELLAEELQLAQNHLSEITGEFTSDDLLGEIFSNFCIGK